MFDNKRFVTKGVNEKVDIRLQVIMWDLIYSLRNELNVELDYLQVFKVRREGGSVIIEHCQEIPKYQGTYIVDIKDISLEGEFKVYVIDGGSYSTMLLAEEY